MDLKKVTNPTTPSPILSPPSEQTLFFHDLHVLLSGQVKPSFT